MELEEYTRKGHFALTSGDAEVSASPGTAGAISHGGTAIGGHQDANGGWNIAGAGPGMGVAHSEAGPGPTMDYLEDGSARRGSNTGPAAAMGAVGGAAAVGVPAAAAGCCCCVIM